MGADRARLNGEMQKIDRELEVDDEEQLFLDRCDAGLFTLQQIDIILVRLANMGNRQVADEIMKLLDVKGVAVKQVLEIVREYCHHLDDSAKQEHEDLMNYTRAAAKRTGTPGFEEVEEEQEELKIRPEKKETEKEKKKERKAAAAPDAPSNGREEKRPAEKEKREKDEKKEKKDKKKDKDRG